MGCRPRCCQIRAIPRETKRAVLHVQWVRETQRLETQSSIQGKKKNHKRNYLIYVYSFCNSETKKHTNTTIHYGPMALLSLFVQTWFNCDNIQVYL